MAWFEVTLIVLIYIAKRLYVNIGLLTFHLSQGCFQSIFNFVFRIPFTPRHILMAVPTACMYHYVFLHLVYMYMYICSKASAREDFHTCIIASSRPSQVYRLAHFPAFIIPRSHIETDHTSTQLNSTVELS